MTVWTPGWLQGGTFTAQVDRINSRAADWDEGVASRVDLKVTQRGAGANLSVDVAVGSCVITGDDQVSQGNYNVYNDAVFNLTGFSAPGSNSRYDLVGMQINDPNAGGAAGSNAVIVRVAGTAAATPTVPATPASFLPLAIIGPILTSTTSITTAMIHDAHTGTGPTGVTGVRLLQGFRDAPGTMKDTFNAVAPNGWLVAAGQAVSRSGFAALFEHFGTTFGAGDGSSTFNLPDMRGRVFVALDNQGGSDAARLTAANAPGGVGGEEIHVLTTAEMPVHNHAITDPGHVHGVNNSLGGSPFLVLQHDTSSPDYASVLDFSSSLNGMASVGIANATTGITLANAGSGAGANNMPPYMLGYKIVRT